MSTTRLFTLHRVRFSILIIALAMTVIPAWADGSRGKGFESEVEGLTIVNASFVSSSQKVIRGAAPRNAKEVSQLRKRGVTAVVILRDKPKRDLEMEIAALAQNGFKPNQIFQLPLYWDKKVPFQESCEMTVKALQVLIAAERMPNQSVYFHCSAGEDRTGMVAGLYRMLTQNWTATDAFNKEMCPNGYEAGDPSKPENIVRLIRANLTPVYLKMVRLIEAKALTADHLDPRVCLHDPGEFQRIPVCQKRAGFDGPSGRFR